MKAITQHQQPLNVFFLLRATRWLCSLLTPENGCGINVLSGEEKEEFTVITVRYTSCNTSVFKTHILCCLESSQPTTRSQLLNYIRFQCTGNLPLFMDDLWICTLGSLWNHCFVSLLSMTTQSNIGRKEENCSFHAVTNRYSKGKHPQTMD